MNKKEKKLYKTLALVGALTLAILFIALIIVGIFFSNNGAGLMLGLIVAITVLAVLIYVILLFARMK